MKLNVVFFATGLLAVSHVACAKALDIYFIDVEGGQSTLLVTPSGESLLIDTGFAGNEGRDAKRIAAAARNAGIKQIDYLLITHFHGDHDGGVPELAQLIPIRMFIDHGSVVSEAEKNVPGTMAAFDEYAKVRSMGKHLEPKPGDRLPIKGIDAIVVSSGGAVLTKPLPHAGGKNPSCAPTSTAAQDPNENPRSTGIRVQFGKFKFLDVGDLTGQPLFALVCPKDLVGAVDVYLVAHHGGPDAADPATFAAFKPRVAVMNNGEKKGGALPTYAALHHVQGLEDVWQLHRSMAAGPENFADAQIANLDESTGHWIKLTANEDGSFKVSNGRIRTGKNYPPR